MVKLPDKRLAIEPATVLFQSEKRLPADAPRPSPIVGGTALIALRAALAVLWGVGFTQAWPRIVVGTALGSDPKLAQSTLISVLVLGALWTLVLVLFAWKLWLGSDRARLLVLVWTTLSITVAAVDYFVNGSEITVRTTLLTLALDILILLALSSRDARAWCRRLRQ